MQKYWFSSESPMGGLMETEEPNAGNICPESGPYYLAADVHALLRRLEEADEASAAIAGTVLSELMVK